MAGAPWQDEVACAASAELQRRTPCAPSTRAPPAREHTARQLSRQQRSSPARLSRAQDDTGSDVGQTESKSEERHRACQLPKKGKSRKTERGPAPRPRRQDRAGIGSGVAAGGGVGAHLRQRCPPLRAQGSRGAGAGASLPSSSVSAPSSYRFTFLCDSRMWRRSFFLQSCRAWTLESAALRGPNSKLLRGHRDSRHDCQWPDCAGDRPPP